MDIIRQPDRVDSDPQPSSATAPATAEGAEAESEATAAAAAAAASLVKEVDEVAAAPKYIFQLVRAPFATPAVKVLLEGPMSATIRSEEFRSPRGETATSSSSSQQLKEGDGLEISPLALATCDDIGRRIASSKGGGAAILIDYGEDFTQVR